MFVAASTRCFAEEDLWTALRRLADMEFDKVDIWLDESGPHLKPSEVVAAPEQFINQLRDETRLVPIAFTLAHEIDQEVFQALCEVSKRLRITQINLPPAPLGTPFNSEIDRLKSLVAAAKLEGIRVAIRTERGGLTEDAHTAVELCQAIKGLGLAFDPSYFLKEGFDKLWKLMAPHTNHVFLRDSTANQLQVQVGLGDIDYSDLMSELRQSHYNRALSIELLPELLEMESRPLEIRKIRLLLESLL
ncbi:MAG: sugar phosphate isomerase/epimerase [Planctomycetaceae bacterium]|nr:sugar phosphate isomerase/epimerase [Planctomycetaceae bacterium]